MSLAFVFPGQGAQTIGMGRDLAESYPAARAVFDEVDEALGEKLSALIWEGEQDKLTLTENAQPALMATSLAALKALEAEGVPVSAASFVAGHSRGEYSALAAAGTFSISDTARLLRLRGKAMQAAVPVGVGAMAAILGLDVEAVRALADDATFPPDLVLARCCTRACRRRTSPVTSSSSSKTGVSIISRLSRTLRLRASCQSASAAGWRIVTTSP